MNKDILNIVVTGGPCGGKTTALTELTNLLRSYGYTVYLTDEVATELINDGIKPFGDNHLDSRLFQSLIFDAQLAKEEIRRKAAEFCPNSKVAILYDRGLLDNRGYISDEIFDEFLKERGMSEAEILTRYDLIIHLVTAAIGKEEYYTTINNSARTETKEEARLQDRKTMEAWRNHPNLKIVGNDTLFEEKVQRVNNYIRSYIGEDEVLKQERFLVDINDIDLKKFNHQMIKESIEEFVLSYDNDDIELFSKSTINGSSYYTCTKKKKNDNTRVCRTISDLEYLSYRNMIKGDVINKTRYNIIDGQERYRLDLFELNSTFGILERDVTNYNKRQMPSFIEKRVDITNNRDFDDDSIFIDYNISKIYKKSKKNN